ncbi:hypothetical protein F5890DRAFT_1417065 [Lentinula detonsa]|uniref:F-box domain-containing protein n=1 Tax=Lentinula detonsa TaxID=2804962 RepID=A0AA38PUW7_9AGAR|nr:hypothetical protein F5890DRAFT_1417065 [Lentinula detonsa]
MELSLEAYRIIINNVRSRVDLATLCLVSKGFRRVAERALYNTLFMHEAARTKQICKALASQSRVAELVEALTIAIEEDDRRGEEEERVRPETQEDIWPAISDALKKMARLRHLSVVIDGTLSSPYSGRLAWILNDCPFRLKSFHSDMRWDEDLVRFLNVQDEIEDLYIGDYDEGQEANPTAPSRSLGAAVNPPGPSTRLRSYVSHSNLTISPSALPHLYTLECTFSEAAIAIVPGRPVSKLKTCFSRTDPEGKREEMQVLFKALGMALAAGGWHALDIADAEYEEKFAMDLTSTMLAGGVSTRGTLKYLGTLVLPVGGRERLLFYGLLMQLRRLCCVELEITAWNPSPAIVGSVAFRALGNELRLYCPGVVKIVFVSMNAGVGDDIGERTTVEWVKGEGMARVESEVMNGMGGSEGLWRDV